MKVVEAEISDGHMHRLGAAWPIGNRSLDPEAFPIMGLEVVELCSSLRRSVPPLRPRCGYSKAHFQPPN